MIFIGVHYGQVLPFEFFPSLICKFINFQFVAKILTIVIFDEFFISLKNFHSVNFFFKTLIFDGIFFLESFKGLKCVIFFVLREIFNHYDYSNGG